MVGTIFGLENIEKRKEKYSLITHDIVENADVCIVGSGAAGAILAEKLTNKGKSVVLLERGGYYDAEDMNQRELDMMPLLWKNGGANFTDNLRIVIAQGQCLGGSTIINDAVCFKTPDLVREQWRAMGVNISDQRWDKAIDEVWNAIHVSKVQEQELNDNNLMLKKACQLKGYKSSENNRNCIDCMRCGFCHLGCHYETKQDMLVTYIRKALRNPESNIRIYCNCSAEKITHLTRRDEKGHLSTATGVEANIIDGKRVVKFKLRVNAKVIIVSAGAIASSQLLIKSVIADGKTGNDFSLHPAPFLLGKFERKINAYNGIPMGYTCHQFGVTNGIADGGFLIESIFLPIFQFSLGLPSFLEGYSGFMEDFNHYTMAGVLIRDEATGSITLSENGNPKVNYSLTQRDIKNISKGLQTLAEMWFDIGADHVITGHQSSLRLNSKKDIPKLVDAVEKDPEGLLISSAHPQGGNRMGEDASMCVVDSNGKVHGFSNLYVCDSSIFPTALGVNPQITVMALATMFADNINEIWDREYRAKRISVDIGDTCSIEHPMYCSARSLDSMFNQLSNSGALETIVNGEKTIHSHNNALSTKERIWSFDKNKLMIYNNRHWKGFFPTDQDFSLIRYLGGFYKQFYVENGKIKGITHPYELPNVFANNVAELRDFSGFGQVIYLRYTNPLYSLFYDLLKIVDPDTIIGKAFIGTPHQGKHILTFSMSRR
ncbi:MAG TPA: GMC family oxidoreductase, partial [Nitrososphaeraceae archaeon]|nr:GMC family oxidoreductase [Nitrososphaeraceae archaeon]